MNSEELGTVRTTHKIIRSTLGNSYLPIRVNGLNLRESVLDRARVKSFDNKVNSNWLFSTSYDLTTMRLIDLVGVDMTSDEAARDNLALREWQAKLYKLTYDG